MELLCVCKLHYNYKIRFIVLCEPGFRQADNMGFAGVNMQFKVAKLIANAVTIPL